MSKKLRIEFDSEGFQALLNSPEVKKLLQTKAEAIAAEAGPGFEVEEFQASFGRSPRPAVTVSSATTEARKAQAERSVLEKAIYSGR